MKSARLDKLEVQPLAAGTSLSELLAHVLPRAVRPGEMLFFDSAFPPGAIQMHWLPRDSEQLLPLANNAVSSREEPDLSAAGAVGQLCLSACCESANRASANRRGPRQPATWRLGGLGSRIPPRADGFAAA